MREAGRYLFFFVGLAWSPVAIPPFAVAMMMNLCPSVYTRAIDRIRPFIFGVEIDDGLFLGWMDDGRDGFGGG